MTAEYIALTNAVKYCGSGKGSQPGRKAGRAGQAEGCCAESTSVYSQLCNKYCNCREKNSSIHAFYQVHTAQASSGSSKSGRKAVQSVSQRCLANKIEALWL